jgi:hypothetical protein
MKRNWKTLVLFPSFLLGVISITPIFSQTKCSGSTTLSLSDVQQKAYDSLLQETMFALGGTGYSGVTSDGEKAMRTLISDPVGESALLKLSTSNSGAGGLYGLVGLKLLNSKCFEEAYGAFKTLPDIKESKGRHETLAAGEVAFMSGCLYTVMNRKELGAQIFRGKFDPWIGSIKSQLNLH